ncbi:Protein of unknown function DUF2878 [Methylophilaceae bacterium]
MDPRLVVNFVLFQIGWFACVLGAAKQMPWLGFATVIAIFFWHLSQAKKAKKELQLLLITLIIGGTFDQIMLNQQLVSYQAHGWTNTIVPVWILALWAEFVTVLNVSLRWMKGRWLIAILFGAIGGPLAYMGAEKLGAVTLNHLPVSYIVLGLGWAILTPLLLKLSQKFDGFAD